MYIILCIYGMYFSLNYFVLSTIPLITIDYNPVDAS